MKPKYDIKIAPPSLRYGIKASSMGGKFLDFLGDRIDKRHHSTKITREELDENKLSLGNNGASYLRDDGPIGKIFNIYRHKENNAIVWVQLHGLNKNKFNNSIPASVRKYYQGHSCKVLGSRAQIQIDHKDGRKDDYSGVEEVSEFQPLHKTANMVKRQVCKECKSSGKRFDATKLGYSKSVVMGQLKYNGTCQGCYWYDPFEFNQLISNQ
jgi:hypothetical protein